MKVDPFIEAEKVAGHNVNKACGLLEVSRAAYYQRRNGPPSARQATDAELLEHITAIHTESKGTYRSPRIHRELGHRQVACGRRRVTRLMRQAGLEGRCKKRWRKTTVPDPDAQAARDLIGRYFARGEDIDRRYVGDITYIGTWEGWAYLATVIDLASRRVVGWALADHMRTELVQDALKMAFAHRAPEKGVVFHSDRGGNTPARTTPHSPATTAWCSPSDARANVGTTRWPNRFSPPSSANSSTPVPGRQEWDFAVAYSSTSRAGTTPAGCTRRSATSVPPNTKLLTTTPTVRRHDRPKQSVRQTGSSPPARCST